MTNEQIIGIVIAVIVFVLVLKVTKKVLKIVLSVAVIVGLAIYIGLVTPQQLQDVSQYVTANADKVTEIVSLAKDSDYIKAVTTGSNLEDIKIQVGGQWVSLDMIENVVSISGDTCTITMAGQQYTIEDENVAKLLEMFESSRFTSSGINSLMDALGSSN